jgi:hypothetical protein
VVGSLVAFVAATVSRDLGFDTGRSTFIVSSVRPASPAAVAGLRPGDELRFGDMTLHDQLAATRYGRQLLTSDVVRLVYARSGAVHRAVVHSEPLALDQNYFLENGLSIVAGLLVGTLMIVVLISSPTAEAIAFWCIAEN